MYSIANSSHAEYDSLSAGFHAFTSGYTDQNGSPATQGYQLFIPVGYDPATAWNTVAFAHGSGEQGSNNTAQLTAALGQYVSDNAATFPYPCIFPQYLLASSFTGGLASDQFRVQDSLFMGAVNDALTRVNVNRAKLHLIGFSYGADRIWGTAYRNQSLFASVIPVEGQVFQKDIFLDETHTADNGYDAVVAMLPGSGMVARVYHQTDDVTVSISYDDALAAAMTTASVGDPPFSYITGSGHGHDFTWAISDILAAIPGISR